MALNIWNVMLFAELFNRRESVRGYIWDSPLQFYMAYVLGLVLLLCPLVPCYGFCFVFGGMCPLSWYDVGDFGPDLVMVGIFGVIPWQFCWLMFWGLFCCYVPWFLVMVSVSCLMALIHCMVPMYDISTLDLVMGANL